VFEVLDIEGLEKLGSGFPVPVQHKILVEEMGDFESS
jgi:hypothetical protein